MEYNASHITTLEDLLAVRNSASMYVGELAIPGQNQCIKELTDNSNDEHKLLNHGLPIEVLFCFKEDTYQVIVIDKGRGIPVYNPSNPSDDVLRRISYKLHTSGKFGVDGPYEAPTGTYGLGLKAAMALSKDAAILTCHNGNLGYIHYKQGLEANYNIVLNTEYTESGTIVIFEPDKDIFADIEKYKEEGLDQFVDYMQFISIFATADIKVIMDEYNEYIDLDKFDKKIKNDLTIGFNSIKKIKRGKSLFSISKNLDLETYVRRKFETNSPTVWKLDNINKAFEDSRLAFDIKLFLTQNIKANKNGIMATVNETMINEPSSHHIVGISECLKSYLVNYIEEQDVKDYFKSFYKLPLYTVARIRYKGAKFLDQTKKGFKDPVFLQMYKNSLEKIFSSIEAETWENLFELIHDDILNKFKDNFNKNYTSVKGLKNINLYLKNGKRYRACVSKDKSKCELYIVEGKSAFNAASQACNNFYQAIFALQGKPKNYFKGNEDELLKNDAISDIMKILGVTPKDTNLDNMNFGKIYLLADADHHGFHICVLVLGILLKINPLIIKEGRVFLSNPPLYSLAMKGKMMYLKDFNALMESKIEVLYRPTFMIHARYQDSEILTPIVNETFNNLCFLVSHVAKIIHDAASYIGMEDYMVELFLKYSDYKYGDYVLDQEKIKKVLGAQNIQSVGEHLIISINELDVTIPWKRFKEECDKYLFYEYNKFKCKMFDLFITTKHTDLYKQTPITITALNGVLNKLDEHFGKFEYFKGLGEMNINQLRATCFDEFDRGGIKIWDIGDLEVIYGMLDVKTDMRKLLTQIKYDLVR